MTGPLGGPVPTSPARHVLTLGEGMVLLFNEHVGPWQLGSQLRTAVGGAEINLALGLARLGHPVEWLGVLGDDTAGDLVLQRLSAGQVGTTHVRREPRRTGLLVRERRNALGSQVHYWRHDSAGSQLSPADVPAAAFGPGTLLHITGITPALSESAAEAVHRAVQLARAAGVPVSFDINYRSRLWDRSRARQVLRPLLHADIVFATIAEARLLLEQPGQPAPATDDPALLAEALHDQGAADVIIKRGRHGAVLRTAARQVLLAQGPTVPTLDSVGAGDAFAAGYLAGVLQGLTAAARLDLAVRTGAYAVTVPGDAEALPRQSDLDDLDAEDADHR